jgi:hypothetical protein
MSQAVAFGAIPVDQVSPPDRKRLQIEDAAGWTRFLRQSGYLAAGMRRRLASRAHQGLM